MKHPQQAKKAQQGFTLIEFMVSIVISMAVVIAASFVYLNSRETQRTLAEKATLFENARFVLDTIGRDMENAGFYPTIRTGGGGVGIVDVLAREFAPPEATSQPAFRTAVFGCQNAAGGTSLNLTAPAACAPMGGSGLFDTSADTLVVNYYTTDNFGLDAGQRADCARQDSANNPVNTARRHAGHATPSVPANSFLLPVSPLFVSNRYTLVRTTGSVVVEGTAVAGDVFSFACNGSGKDPNDNLYQPLVMGINQLSFAYLMRPTADTPARYLRASAVTDWSAVTAVRVCVLARALQRSRVAGSTADITQTVAENCYGSPQTWTDGIDRKVFTQVFALKNRLTESN